MTQIRRGMCRGCPYDIGKPDTEEAYNLGCLPGTGEIRAMCDSSGTAWACHDEPNKVCCGYAAAHKSNKDLPLLHVRGVHGVGEVA